MLLPENFSTTKARTKATLPTDLIMFSKGKMATTHRKIGKSWKKSSKVSSGFKKAPQAPRRFKSPYILFSIHKIQSYKQKHKNAKVTSFSSLVSKEWKSLSAEEKQKWKQAAERDKQRYNAEKLLYKGPWQVRSDRMRKDPTAPKRPPSAFLNYCRIRRPELIEENPDVKNTDISKLLGIEWGSISQKLRQPHIDREKRERAIYNQKMVEWRQQQDLKSEVKIIPENTPSFVETKESVRTRTSSLGRPLPLPAQLNRIPVPRSMRQVSLPSVNCVANNIVDTNQSMRNQEWPSTLEPTNSQNHRFPSLLSSQSFVIPEPKPIYPDLLSGEINTLLPDAPTSLGTSVTFLLNPRETLSIADFEELFFPQVTNNMKNDNNPLLDFSLHNSSIDIEGMD